MKQNSGNREPLSPVRKSYTFRLVGRCIILLICAAFYFWKGDIFSIAEGMNFFKRFSVLHLLWGVWVIDMVFQLMPVKNKIALGSQKLFLARFRPITEKINHAALKKYIITTTRSAYKVMLLWIALGAAIGMLYFKDIIGRNELFLLTVLFYVCDLICVLIWCPFRLLMKNKCCTTCRIFNWDHLMMFTPMLFIPSFYTWSLCLLAIAVWAVWEVFVFLFPERFWENSNDALKCSNCTDKLCIQYCRKLRQ